MLKENYASSSYAKSLDNKNFFKEAKAQDSVVNRLYEEAYTLYRAEQYEQAFNALKNIERNHPESHLADKIKLLSAMLMVKTSDDLEEVEQVLGQFLSENKNSELVPLAQSLLDHIKKKRGGE
jgi:outer membrane protein assembly factor BamD (BamD/ComL family)